MITKPMKAATYVAGTTQLQWPQLATDKFDGIRCIKVDGKALTTSFKPIANDYIREWVQEWCPDGFDGELMPADPSVTFNDWSGMVRRKDGKPDFHYFVFDYVMRTGRPYTQRVDDLKAWRDDLIEMDRWEIVGHRVKLELPTLVSNEEELLRYEEKALARGREGVMVRTADSPYKCGRSTISEGYLIKIKRFEDAEADLIDILEMMENQNPAELDNFGRTKRSKHQEGMVPKGTMGKLVCRRPDGVEFEIGTGFTEPERQRIWDSREALIAAKELVKYKHQPHGAKEKPRCPVFLAFRDRSDT